MNKPIDPEIRALLEQANNAMMPVLLSSTWDVLVNRAKVLAMHDAHVAIMKALAADDVAIAMDNAGVDEPRHLDVEALVKARSSIRESIERILPSDPEADAIANKVFAKAYKSMGKQPIFSQVEKRMFEAIRIILARGISIGRIVRDADDNAADGLGEDVSVYLWSPSNSYASLTFIRETGEIVAAWSDRTAGGIRAWDVSPDGIGAAIDELAAFLRNSRPSQPEST